MVANPSLINQEIIDHCKIEQSTLKNEAAHLKDCQIQILTFSITATALLLAVLTSGFLVFAPEIQGFIMILLQFLPLFVLIPCIWIFFDKVKTYNRLIGYYYIIEEILLGRVKSIYFLGWENSLNFFRKNVNDISNFEKSWKDENNKQSNWKEQLNQFFYLRQYWLYALIIFFCFIILSVILADIRLYFLFTDPQKAIIGQYPSLFSYIFSSVFLYILIVSFLNSLSLYTIVHHVLFMREITGGIYSDRFNKRKWIYVLKINYWNPDEETNCINHWDKKLIDSPI